MHHSPFEGEPRSKLLKRIVKSDELGWSSKRLQELATTISKLTFEHQDQISPIPLPTELNHLKNGHVFVALGENNTLAGFVHMIPIPWLRLARRNLTWLAALYLDPAYRGGDRHNVKDLIQTAINAYPHNYIMMDTINPKVAELFQNELGFEVPGHGYPGKFRLEVALNLPQLMQNPSVYIQGFRNKRGIDQYTMLVREPVQV